MSGTTRALVLGGGGITGIAWETGLLAGLVDAGIDLTAADRVIGTSAGSVVGAQITSDVPVGDWYAKQLLPPRADGVPLARIGVGTLLPLGLAMARARGSRERFGRLAGSLALRASERGRTPTIEDRYAQVAQRIGGLTWSGRDLRVTAVDVATGALEVFGPRGTRPEVSLEDAVNASCAVPGVYPPIPIDGRTYIDGGARSNGNGDLAAGCDVVVALAPMDQARGLLPSTTAEVRALGVPHLVITPDDVVRAARGRNVLDPAARPPTARAGYAQAATVAERLREIWG